MRIIAKTMKTRNKWMAAAALLTLAACSNDDNLNAPFADGPIAAQVTAGISNGQAVTRVSVGNDGSASFTANDAIHVVAGGSSTYVYTFNGSLWTADSPYYFQDRNTVSFRAWYSATTLTETNNSISINTTSQTSTGDWNNWDILATPAVSTTVSDPTINFTGDNAFQHIMSQVTFTFKAGDGISDLTNLTQYTLKGLVAEAAFNTLTCELTTGSNTDDIAMTVSGATGAEHTCTPIILVPQTVTGGTFTLDVTYNDQTYTATLNLPDGGFLSGYSYTYTVTIKNTKLEVGDAEIAGWETSPYFNGNGDATLQ